MTSNDLYKVKIEGNGVSIEKAVSKEIGDEIIILAIKGFNEKGNSHSVSALSKCDTIEGREAEDLSDAEQSISEFIKSHNAKRVPDKIAAIGVYLKNVKKRVNFTKDDIKKEMQNAAEPIPANLSRDIKWSVSIGFIAKKDSPKNTFYVTNTGQDAVSKNFSDDIIKKSKLTVKGPKKKNDKKEENGN